MNLVFTLLFCTSPITANQDKREAAYLAKLDSVPSQFVYQIKSALLTEKQAGRRLLTLVIQPAKNRLSGGINLPLGVDERTIQVSADDRLLRLGDDYVFVSDANQIRILKENVLKSERPITVTYEQSRFAYKP